jgi:hypothetical protein
MVCDRTMIIDCAPFPEMPAKASPRQIPASSRRADAAAWDLDYVFSIRQIKHA